MIICPHCNYQDYYREKTDVGIPGYSEIIKGDLGEFYKVNELPLTRWSHAGKSPIKSLYGCPKCNCCFIGD